MQRSNSGNKTSPPILGWVFIAFFMFQCNKTAPSTAPSLPSPTSGKSSATQGLPPTPKADGEAKGQTQAQTGEGQPTGETSQKAEEKPGLAKNKTQTAGTDPQAAPKTTEKTDSDTNPPEFPAGELNTGEPAKTPEERRAEAERRFDESLAEFERRLSKEKKILRKDRPMGASAGGAGSVGSVGMTPALPQSRAEGLAKPHTTQQGQPSGGDGQSLGTATHNNGGRVPTDIPDGNDDDIVARQLREAAMQEDDPVLREKLWQEYRKYKNGTGKGETSRQQ